ncbi:MAG: hypothetical protein E7813_03905 [Bradyrhizobium sp.]|uniref:hypothetical protein n=1 Tax=Bradyrhizobium sp. TaxID=376 RepID=UPI0011F4CE12|nr:hypothetical protein [Bradyrhizobium sp.]THD72518.1 MAG: hypothetical protein E7813_03905 [Bradyrhizobium sp.]
MVLKKPVITDSNLPEPKAIDDDWLRAIFDAFAVEPERRDATKKYILTLIREWPVEMREIRLQPSRDADRQKIDDAAGKIRQAIELLSSVGPAGREALRSATPSPISKMLNTGWLREEFPDEDTLPLRSSGLAEVRSPRRSRQVYVEEDTEEGRYHAVNHRPSQTITAILRDIDAAVSQSLVITKEAGGRKPATLREFFIVNLYEAWRISGKPVEASQEFFDFCGAVFEGVGWSDQGIADEVLKSMRGL